MPPSPADTPDSALATEAKPVAAAGPQPTDDEALVAQIVEQVKQETQNSTKKRLALQWVRFPSQLPVHQ